MKRFCYALILLLLSAPVSFTAKSQSEVSRKVNRPPVAREAARVLPEDGTAVVALRVSDPDGDALTLKLVSPPRHGRVTFRGSTAVYVPDADFFGSDRFTYAASDGSTASEAAPVVISVTPVDDAPRFVSSPGNLQIREAEPFWFQYVARDVEGDPVAYRLIDPPDGATIDPGTGILEWTPGLDQEGSYRVRVAASDGSRETVSDEHFVVLNTEIHAGTFSPVHVTAPVMSQATGTVQVTYDDVANTLTMDATFSGLSSDRGTASAFLGPFGEDSDELVELVVQDDPANPGVSTSGRLVFPQVGATFDLDLLAFFPDLFGGVTAEMVVDSLRSGKVYLVVRSLDHPDGEIRAHLRSVTANSAPETPTLDLPATVTIEGDPSATGMTVSWSAPVDADGDPTRQVLGFWTDPEMTDMRILHVDDGSHTLSYTVDQLAGLFSDLTGGSTGSTMLYAAVMTTDGANIATSAQASVNLVRGQVTTVEDRGVVPDVFMLRGNFPNPFNPTTTIQFDLPQAAEVEVYVTDLLGRVVLTVPAQALPAGIRRQIPIDAGSLASGIYIYRVSARADGTTHVATGTMTLLK